MLIGANFLRSMKGGIRIEGDEITIYKKVTKIKTSNQTEIAKIVELEVSEEEFLEINESIYFNQEGSRAFQEQFKPVINRLGNHQDILDKNPSSTGKRMEEAKNILKFDIKSDEFHQVAMEEESIPWTAFLVPGGLYEWLVMPFGLKNAPAVFQRKMDKCFKGTESFIAVYIDDILVFSKNEKDHAKHLEKMLKICEDNGFGLISNEMKISSLNRNFHWEHYRENEHKAQPHIIKKIVNFNEEELKTKKGLRLKSALGNQPRETTCPSKEDVRVQNKEPKKSTSNLKPCHKDWDVITSNYSEENAINDDDNSINDDNKYRYNRIEFLEDDESSDDLIFIVDPGWDDYSLQAIKSNRPVPLCPEARRVRM
ncbi:ORFIII-like polyprotein [Tanacetum coccineum]